MKVNRDTIFKQLKEEGVGVNVHYMPIHLHPYYKNNLGTDKGFCPVAEKVYDEIITLPMYPGLTNEEINYVIEKVKLTIENYKKKTGVIIQARLGSTRFPGKVLKILGDKTVLDHVCERLSRCKNIDKIIIATTNKESDDKILDFCKERNICCFRGDENNVLERYYLAAKEFELDTIVRVTSDCPLIDPEIVDDVITKFFENGLEYYGMEYSDNRDNGCQGGFPDGTNPEIFSFKVLEEAYNNANSSQETVNKFDTRPSIGLPAWMKK